MTAVDHLCLGIPRGECFGLLGINGKRNVKSNGDIFAFYGVLFSFPLRQQILNYLNTS